MIPFLLHRHVKAACGVTAALVVLLASCGGGSGTKSSSTTVPGGSTSTTSAGRSSAQLAADRQTARAALLRLSDLPAGWDAKARDDSSNNTPALKAAEKAFGQCLGIDPALLSNQDDTTKATATSDKFTDGQNMAVENNVEYEPDTTQLNQVMTALQQPQARQCFQTFVNTAVKSSIEHPSPGSTIPQGVTFGNPEVATVNLPGLNADTAVDYRVSMPVSARGFTISVYLDLLFATRARAVTLLTYQDVSKPFPADRETRLANTVLNRLPGAGQTAPPA